MDDVHCPIGIFDSGIGGLSVLRHIHTHLPNEHLLYFADSAFAPYGGKPEEEIVARTLAIADFLLQQGSKALVVACNTATSASINALRERYPELAVVGVEPGLKPAAALSKTHIVGVLATERTLASAKFALLREQITTATSVQFLLQACIGLADQIEKGELCSNATASLVRGYVAPLIEQGADTLVLGCTHYPFVQQLIEDIVQSMTDKKIDIIDTGAAVARQLARCLAQQGLTSTITTPGTLAAFSSGSASSVETAFLNLLKIRLSVTSVRV